MAAAKSKKFEEVKGYYENGYWSVSWVSAAVSKGWITKEEYEEITGSEYTD